ncbi:MAG: hypothetical protein ACRDBP_01770 [Luteolibacter sp.]
MKHAFPELLFVQPKENDRGADETNPLANKDLEDFVKCYGCSGGVSPSLESGGMNAKALKNHSATVIDRRYKRKETERFKKFTYAEIVARDKANLDILWLKDDSLEDSDNLPAPALLATCSLR